MYYCDNAMQSEMKNIQSINLETPKQVLYYFTRVAEVKNVLGIATATLVEYIISIDEDVKDVLLKLYKTADGFWYETTGENDRNSNGLRFAIKSAIDVKESETKR
jgi:hypothetical protein